MSAAVAVKVLDVRAAWTTGPVELRLSSPIALDYMYNLGRDTRAGCAPSLSPPSGRID